MHWVFVIKNVSVKLFSFFKGRIICGQGRVCETLQLLQWMVYWWSRTCLSNSSASSMQGVLVMKNVSVKLFSFFSGGIIGDQERVCQNFSFINGGSICDQERVCQTLQLLLTCLSNSSASLMEGVLVIKNVSVKLFSFFICSQGRVCETLQLLQWMVYLWSRSRLSNSSTSWREYWWSRTCLSNSSASSMEGVLVIKNVSVKISASLMEGVLVIKNVSVKLFSFFNGGSIGDQERVCQTLQLH